MTVIHNIVCMLEYRGLDVSQLEAIQALTAKDFDHEFTEDYLQTLTITAENYNVYFCRVLGRMTV